ncbi:uncharacterized protein ARMOST_13944 [Armillaria ostoyae]|uniref:Uncharacterized protein n=1 Tax=Armillaria ostoyae TaxID=47428 RepID=A0A284RP78_ARMOS|nr:uncharacterized protein ARMOST_13944 [Armillaria ostoyae]
MDSPPPRHTWREFLGIRFDHHIAVQERTDCGHTHSYSAINCPPAEEFIRQSDPDPTIVERILESFLSYLVRKGCLNDLLPISLDVFLHMLQSRFPRLNLVDEPMITLFHARLLGVVDMAVEVLTSTDAETMYVTLAAPSLIFSQQGDSNWATWNSRTRTHIQTTTIEGKQPRALSSHAASLQLEINYAPSVQQVDGKAMATRMWLHLASSSPPSRFGYFFSGISAVIVEKVLLQPDHNALLVSPHSHLFRDDNPPTSAEYEFISADRCCVKGIPLVAIPTFLHLPNELMRKALRALPRPMTAAPEGKK